MSSFQPSPTKARAKSREEVAKRRRLKTRKVPSTPPTQTRTAVRKPSVIDLTSEEEKDPQNQTAMPTHLESDDYFDVLGLQRSASEADIKKAYRKLAVQWHPDKNRSNPRAEEVFKRISEAYEVLSDREKRKVYEKYGKAGLTGAVPASYGEEEHFTHSGFGTHFSTQHARDIFDAFFGGEDPFEAFFGGGRQRRTSSQRRGPFGDAFFDNMGFGGMGMHGFGSMGGISTMDSFFSDGFGAMDGSSTVFSTSSSSSSSSFTDRNGHFITQKTTTTTGMDGRTETVTEEFRDGKLVHSTSSTESRLAGAGRMQLERDSNRSNHHRRGSRPKY